ncbi:MAG: hypothetical protein JWP66_937 [Naasia sp.]|nr:hypothetical protein [Naasia sp.]
MTCPVCGATLPADAFFCGACGSAVGTRDERDGPPRRRAAPRTGHLPPAAPALAEWSAHLAAPPSAAPDERETAVAVPPVPAPSPPAPAPAAAAPAPTASGAAERPLAPEEFTRLPAAVPRPAATRFVLVFSTGEHVVVEGTGLIGRRPQPQPGEAFDSLVTIDDPGRSVSKTHVEFGQDGGSFWVSDRYSANGTVVREPDRPARLSAPGMRSRVARGSRVEIGEQFFVVS